MTRLLNAAPKTPKPPATERPAYWFFILEDARENGDTAGEARARRELARLGVRVSYGTKARKERAG
jgi:hypothetical protein